MSSWIKSRHSAFRQIKRRDWKKALFHLNEAMKGCRRHPGETARLLYWTGVVLDHLKQREAALKSWRLAQRISAGSPAQSMLRSRTNEYGMPRQESRDMDDWRAFFAIQMERYLSRRHGRFGSAAERDMVCEMIAQEWAELKKDVDLASLAGQEKKRLFRRLKIVFPLFSLSMEMDGREIISFDFRRQVPLAPDDPCSCGSGLPFSQCCGRVSWPLDL